MDIDRKASRPIEGLEQCRNALRDMLRGEWRVLLIYSPYVHARLHSDSEVMALIRRRLVSQPKAQCRIILPSASTWRHGCAHLVELAGRLSAFQLRVLRSIEMQDRAQYRQAFFCLDQETLLRLTDPLRCLGSFAACERAAARELAVFFADIWERSLPDRELQRLEI